MRHRVPCVLLLLSACGAPRLDGDAPGGARPPEAQSVGRLAALAGADGAVTTLAFYDDGTPHPGLNAIDIGAPGGTAVWHQIDYLPDSVRGGYLFVEQAHEAGLCSQWSPGSPYYNGGKLYVTTYFWTGGDWRTHREAYQHVSPEAAVGAWLRWNNAGAAEPLWDPGDEDVRLGDQTAGGLYLGTVYPVPGPIWNGPGGGLCTTGSHLHQEGEGARAPQRRLGEAVTARYSDMHVFWP